MNRNGKIFAAALCTAAFVIGGGIVANRFLFSKSTPDLLSVHTTEVQTETAEAPVEITAAAAGNTETQAETSAAASSGSKAAGTETKSEPVVPAYKVSMETSKPGEGISIAYPVISGMEDTGLQSSINARLKRNAESIIILYPLDQNMDRLSVSCRLNYIDRSRISVIYTGELQLSRQTAQSVYTKESQSLPVQPAENGQPAADISAPLYAADDLDRKLFYTNTVDLRKNESLAVSSFVSPETLGTYVLDDSCIFENKDREEKAVLVSYLKQYAPSYYTGIFNTADFHKNMTAWPESFCYENKGDVVFSVPLPAELGDYCLVRFVPHTK